MAGSVARAIRRPLLTIAVVAALTAAPAVLVSRFHLHGDFR
jgi:hypothetical protein